MASNLYDVVIIGSGPAGSTAAYYLGEAGKKVLVLEKATLPRYKTCGGGLSASLLAQFPFNFDDVIESEVKEISYILHDRVVTFPVPGKTVQMVMRDKFDAHLLAHSRVEVRQGRMASGIEEKEDRVIVKTKQGEKFEGQYLIAADGANSISHRLLGLRRRKTLAAGIEVEVPVPPEVMREFSNHSVFIFGEVNQGYLWIFPKAEHLSVGIGVLHPKPGELKTVLRRVMHRYGISLDDIPQHGHPLPLYTRREKINTSRTLLVGDAAGLVDPFSGEGIRYAIKSGRIAAESIIRGELNRYPHEIYQKIGRSHTFAAALALLFYRFPRLCFILGVQNPFATRIFLDMFSDRTNYAGLILRLFGSLPIYLATEGTAYLISWIGGEDRKERFRSWVYRGNTRPTKSKNITATVEALHKRPDG